jgi:hypothetical protein
MSTPAVQSSNESASSYDRHDYLYGAYTNAISGLGTEPIRWRLIQTWFLLVRIWEDK